jgi:hypothetical protein
MRESWKNDGKGKLALHSVLVGLISPHRLYSRLSGMMHRLDRHQKMFSRYFEFQHLCDSLKFLSAT